MNIPTPPAGFNIERLYHFSPGEYIDAIPPNERDNYYLRGAAVGALALNIAYGLNRVNPRDDLFMHINSEPGSQSYRYAADHAEQFVRGGAYPGHLSYADLELLAEMTGRTGLHPLPGIVIGFPRDKYQPVEHPGSRQPAICEEVPFSAIDPYSQAALTDLIGVNVSTMPLTPGGTRPIREDTVHTR